ncbi:MAG: DUF3179 domain-containing (seleno)protein [Chloroflexi bacterium]|nr:DUF3179 domain-containing (seleno)protein [Chloroflexota bacterium]
MKSFAGFILALVLLLAPSVNALDYDTDNYRKTMIQMLGSAFDATRGRIIDLAVFDAVAASGDPLYIAPLIDIAYFARSAELSRSVFGTLNSLTGQNLGWKGYFEWAGANDIPLPPQYEDFKGQMLAAFVDPEFTRFFARGVADTAKINLVEPVWGGVTVDGIPSLVNARQISPEAARDEGHRHEEFCRDGDCSYPAADELVFGLSFNGDSRAYPLRLLNWHEMFNDVIGHAPLYDQPDGERVCNFRAPTSFEVRGRSGDDWLLIFGRSADCPRSGWLRAADVSWIADDGAAPPTELPDLAVGAEALSVGMRGRVSGVPVMLAYCTLCGAGVLYDVSIPDLTYADPNGEIVELGDTVLEFGSTGMLMRSNKLMYDRNTDTVWNAITGEPAFGPLAATDIALDILPVVVTDWASWLEAHPDTSVLSLDTGFLRNYTNGAAYSDYFNSTELMFPSWQQDTAVIQNKEMVFALRLQGQAKAYPLATIIPERIVNDRVGATDVVIIAEASPEREFFEPGGAAVRAYDRGGMTFSAGPDDSSLTGADGETWRITEAALIAEDGARLERIGGHLAFWFGWFGFYPDTLVYGEAAP